MDGWRRLALAATAVTYLLIALGGIVRITGSGMGCGDHWPLCNGQLIPTMDLATFIEWSHRLVAAFVSTLIAGLALWAWSRREPGWSGRRRYTAWAAALLVVQVLLGAVTVWLELPPTTVILHLGTAMLLFAVLLLAALGAADPGSSDRALAGAGVGSLGMLGLSAVVVLLGALVANLHAAPACQGFPLCNGQLWPAGPWRIQLHWVHRVSAYLLLVGALALPLRVRGPGRVSALAVAGLVVAQVLVAAVMVLRGLPDGWQAIHVAIGTAVFGALVIHARLRASGVGALAGRAVP